MAMLFVFDENINDFVCSNYPLPAYGTGNDCIVWSHSRFIAATDSLCRRFEGLTLKNAFFPLRPASVTGFSAHHAGLAGDFVLNRQIADPIPLLKEIRRWCIKSGLFSYVEPQYKTPLWIHAEVRTAPPASFYVPYPVLFPGNIGPHVFILQKALCLMGFPCVLNGRLDDITLSSLLAFKKCFGLAPDPVVDAATWQILFSKIKKAAKPPV